jgi:hypothetical protein
METLDSVPLSGVQSHPRSAPLLGASGVTLHKIEVAITITIHRVGGPISVTKHTMSVTESKVSA